MALYQKLNRGVEDSSKCKEMIGSKITIGIVWAQSANLQVSNITAYSVHSYIQDKRELKKKIECNR